MTNGIVDYFMVSSSLGEGVRVGADSSPGPSQRGFVQHWRILRNTYLQVPKWFFTIVVSDAACDRILDAKPTKTRRGLARYAGAIRRRSVSVALTVFWFWPRASDAHLWAQADSESSWAPEKYLRDEPRRLLSAVMDVAPKHYAILDLGCNSGSDLNILATRGWGVLAGVDAGDAALQLFASLYPETYAKADVRRDLFQRYLAKRPSQSFDLVYSNGATLELIHPSFPVVAEICRVTRNTVLLDIYERGNPYPRDYEAQFRKSGFRLTQATRPEDFSASSSLLRFDRTS